ncbi:hypothetical protein BDZ89DRAFT_1236656, partial [Hymenopellis radicata]
VDETVVKVLTTQVSVTGGGLDLEDTLLDGQQGNIESSSSEIENKNVAPPVTFLSRPYAMTEAVGSLMIQRTFIPDMVPVSLVTRRWESLK